MANVPHNLNLVINGLRKHVFIYQRKKKPITVHMLKFSVHLTCKSVQYRKVILSSFLVTS